MTKGEQTRQRIIEQAAPIFNQHGYAGASMQDILAATGLEKGGLYRHFSSKEELAAAVFRYSWSRVVEVRRACLEDISGSVQQLQYLVQRFVATPNIIPGGCPLMNTAVDSDDGNPLLRQLAAESLQDWKQTLSGIVEAGIRKGEIRKDVQPAAVANHFISLLEGAVLISRLERSRTAIDDAQSTLTKFLQDLQLPQAQKAPQVQKAQKAQNHVKRSPSLSS